jgi:general secretion pathway protein C
VHPTTFLRPLLPPDLQQLIERTLPVVLVWGLSLIAAWLLGALIWRLAYPDPVPPTAAASASAPAGGGMSQVDAAGVAALHLFGAADQDAIPVAVDQVPDDLPETQLRLMLNGVMAAVPQTASRAFIRVGSDDVAVYAVGEEITAGATLDSVYLDRVILRRAGRLETLRFPASDTPVVAAPRSPPRATQSSPMSAIRQGLEGDPEQLLRIIRPSPYYQDGEQVGYRVVPGQDRAAFNALGLQVGDVITHIDGQPLRDPGTSIVALQRLAQAGRAQVTVLRSGQPVTLTLPVE